MKTYTVIYETKRGTEVEVPISAKAPRHAELIAKTEMGAHKIISATEI